MAEHVLISGGTGLIGSRLLERLNADDVAVRCLTRSARTSSDPRVEYRAWDGIASS